MKNNNKQQGVKNKGYYQSLYDRYVNTAKEHQTSGDHVMYEYNMQHAEHYMRVINERFPAQHPQPKQQVGQPQQHFQHQTAIINTTTSTFVEKSEDYSEQVASITVSSGNAQNNEASPAKAKSSVSKPRTRRKKTEE